MRYTRSKYGNKRTEYNGRTYMSKAEASYARQLDLCMSAKAKRDKVLSYEVQVPFPITLSGKNICKYVCDFVVHYADGRTEVVDVKGVRTDVYKIKKKLVEAQYGVEIVEVTKSR